MKENRENKVEKEADSRYEQLASFLDRRSGNPGEESSLPEEEQEKLLFLWDHCHPAPTDSAAVWNKTLRKIREAEASRPAAAVRKRRLFLRAGGLVAATVVLLLGLAYFWGGPASTVDEKERMAQFMLAHAGEEPVEEVTLVVSDSQKIAIANNAQVAYSPTGEVNVNTDKLQEAPAPKAGTESEAMDYNQLIVPKGRRSMIVLADNSKVWVNSGSKVIYPRTFGQGTREIYVEGEVFLKVARDEARPFVVNTSAFEVEVLGTSFNISAPKNSARADVVLVEGEVDVKDHLQQRRKMKPNERLELDETGIARVETVDARDYIHWVDGVWLLNGKPLREVLDYLTEYYGQPVGCDPAVAEEPFYGKLFLNEELEEVLRSIRQTLRMPSEAREQAVYIGKK